MAIHTPIYNPTASAMLLFLQLLMGVVPTSHRVSGRNEWRTGCVELPLTMSACDSFLNARVVHTVQICLEETTLSQAMAFTLQVRAGLSSHSHSTQQCIEMAMTLESSEADDLHRDSEEELTGS